MRSGPSARRCPLSVTPARARRCSCWRRAARLQRSTSGFGVRCGCCYRCIVTPCLGAGARDKTRSWPDRVAARHAAGAAAARRKRKVGSGADRCHPAGWRQRSGRPRRRPAALAAESKTLLLKQAGSERALQCCASVRSAGCEALRLRNPAVVGSAVCCTRLRVQPWCRARLNETTVLAGAAERASDAAARCWLDVAELSE